MQEKGEIYHLQENTSKLTKYQTSIILRASRQILKFEDNFMAMYKDNTYRKCNKGHEIHKNTSWNVSAPYKT